MNIRHFILLFAILALSACAQAATTEQPANIPVPASPVDTETVTQSEVINKAKAANIIEATCFRNSEETQLLINFSQEYCFQYPIGYDVAIQSDTGIMLVKRSILNPQDPKLIITIEPANGMTVEQAADQLVADYSVPGMEVTRGTLEIDQEQAIMVDGLTGEDINRQVVVVHNDRLFHMTFIPMQDSPEVNAQAEVLYNTVIQSFTFRPESNLCSDCPLPTETP
jgi:hypothetical protein